MNKNKYNALKAEIIKQFGKPEWELNQPKNDSAVKLKELQSSYLKELNDAEKTKKLLQDVKNLEVPIQSDVEVPEELLKDSWLTPFDDDGKMIVKQWMLDISQSCKQIANQTKLSSSKVRSTLTCEAFKLLRGNLALAYKQLLPLEASAALRVLLKSKTDNVRLNAARLVLLDAGLFKGDSVDVTLNKPKEVLLDAATEEKLRKLGNDVMDLSNE